MSPRWNAWPSREFSVSILAAAVIVLASFPIGGCSSSQPPQAPHVAVAPSPLNLCAVKEQAPREVSSRPGYAEYFVTVSTRLGPVSGLGHGDFTASVANVSLPVEFFRETASTPASVAIVIDSSGSMKKKTRLNSQTRLEMTRDAISAALARIDACDELALIDFGGPPASGFGDAYLQTLKAGLVSPFSPTSLADVRLLQPLTTDHALLATKLSNDVYLWGQTPLYNSIHSAMLVLSHAHYPDRAVIVVTDGMDDASSITIDEVVGEALKMGVRIYAIGLGDPDAGGLIGPFLKTSGNGLDTDAVGELAAGSGGVYFLVSPQADDAGAQFDKALATITVNIGRGYVIGVVDAGGALPEFRVAHRPEAMVHVSRISSSHPPSQAPPHPPAKSA